MTEFNEDSHISDPRLGESKAVSGARRLKIDSPESLRFQAEAPSRDDIDIDRLIASYDYELPAELIAQNPSVPRDSARLLVVSPDHPSHAIFRDLPDFLQSGDLLVLNNTRVIPARLRGRKSTGAPVEVLLLEEQQNNCWLALVKPGRRLQPGAQIFFEPQKLGAEEKLNPASSPNQLSATILSRDEATGGRVLQFDVPAGSRFEDLLEKYGQVPLPPYITDSQSQAEQYQTVYAQAQGAIAAPTAGLHFTPELLQRLQERGIQQASVTLHVGVGTFRPVEVEDITTHKMHGEWVEVPQSTVEQIRETKARGGRIIAVGTTVVRSLESAAMNGELHPFRGKTELFIYPGYQWRVVEGLITNFHLPRSSLLMLVGALIGRQRLLELYQVATKHRYRFYSFGDAMLILPEATIR
ncbi:tRNA preQ1(34) S-adenosylmethionine ribosyltransferase-isomerase QueA [Coleofasciculus sp. FACHB-542]|uniref:tRNA preQ1(34) S-adenosylmethionine ribosyltransferase-isomerase QueA n=1 Tax=Coleofasciculus sp. FACHB-542 TaxID=2692787 RepID=UPI001682A3BF|nr:tRNA preQ1(34) S-adenosylmethionine ribosyltransferase-isomerase QueA [Coleofasciculus sp. FACHB-542]MBD2087299.1 tRNA preQ1(34) S-adenosylmethionine ribosyltransferase-isomerase QueA [Coleofasciculus sp. FACHB-542]